MGDTTFVLVHLGPDPDKHVLKNVQYLRRNFRNPIVVITDNSKLQLFCKDLGILVHVYVRSKETAKSLESFRGDLDFRDGFWFLTIERLIAFAEFQVSSLAVNLLHVESDVVLLKNFNSGFLMEEDKLWWTNVGDVYDCAALLFSPNPSKAHWLKTEIIKLLVSDPTITDMLALRRIKLHYGDLVSYFPSKLINYDEGPLLFDPLQFGMFLFGSDPRNLFGLIHRYVWWGEVGFQNVNISYSSNLKGELYVIKESRRYQLQNIHNHSKNLLLFGRFQRVTIWFFVLTSKVSVFSKIPSYRFSIPVLKSLLRNLTRFRKYPLILRTFLNITLKR